MKIERAIEILHDVFDAEEYGGDSRIPAAIKLGIEALKAVKDARANSYWTPIPPLPGETEEEDS